jgi:hypothetical protein
MMESNRKSAERLYLGLAAIFIASLVSCNLIFQKFFEWDLGIINFEVSVGILPYPITFLVTDVISEIFGRKRANQVVTVGLFSTIFVMFVVTVADIVPATSWSPVSDEEFQKVFGLTGVAVAASMVAFLLAQFIDIRIYHFWKRLTKGKYLWIRNNFSTMTSQFVDTSAVLLLLCFFNAIEWNMFVPLLINGFLFKILVALCDTPLLYVVVHFIRKNYKLEVNEEIDF